MGIERRFSDKAMYLLDFLPDNDRMKRTSFGKSVNIEGITTYEFLDWVKEGVLVLSLSSLRIC